MSVAKAALRQFREYNKPRGGLLLQVSSMFGLASSPLVGVRPSLYHIFFEVKCADFSAVLLGLVSAVLLIDLCLLFEHGYLLGNMVRQNTILPTIFTFGG
jgi:hypothetical protein